MKTEKQRMSILTNSIDIVVLEYQYDPRKGSQNCKITEIYYFYLLSYEYVYQIKIFNFYFEPFPIIYH